MKAVLLSIKPHYCELIANGKKTIEIRKTKPKLKTPFKCYIYETKAINHQKILVDLDGNLPTIYAKGSGKVIGEFVCDRIEIFDVPYPAYSYEMRKDIQDLSGLGYFQLHKYANHKYRSLYAWYISNLVIYDEPKELSDFYKRSPCKHYQENTYVSIFAHCNYAYPCERLGEFETYCQGKKLTRPPQSWGYVEEIE